MSARILSTLSPAPRSGRSALPSFPRAAREESAESGTGEDARPLARNKDMSFQSGASLIETVRRARGIYLLFDPKNERRLGVKIKRLVSDYVAVRK
jgi:hypothetical protein